MARSNIPEILASRRRSQRLQNFRTNQAVKDQTASRRATRALDSLICSEKTLTIAIDGFS
jgi:hypothetical protein